MYMKNKKGMFLILAVVVGLLSTSLYFYLKFRAASEELAKVAKDPKQEVINILENVGKLMDLPTDEEPTVATVTDKEKLASQKFFSKAENDDKVIIFVKAQKAILYRPSWNKIIEVARIDSIDQASNGTTAVSNSPVASAAAAVQVTILNGTERVGLSTGLLTKLSSFPEFSVVQRLNAVKKDYQKSLVVDIGGKNSELARKLVGLIGGDTSVVTIMPSEEATPSSEMVVILGTDFISSN